MTNLWLVLITMYQCNNVIIFFSYIYQEDLTQEDLQLLVDNLDDFCMSDLPSKANLTVPGSAIQTTSVGLQMPESEIQPTKIQPPSLPTPSEADVKNLTSPTSVANSAVLGAPPASAAANSVDLAAPTASPAAESVVHGGPSISAANPRALAAPPPSCKATPVPGPSVRSSTPARTASKSGTQFPSKAGKVMMFTV